MVSLDGGDGEIRTHVRLPANWFRVSPVMTTSIRLRINLVLNFARLLQGRNWNAVIQNSRKMKHLRDIARKREFSQVAEWWARLPFESAPLCPARVPEIFRSLFASQNFDRGHSFLLPSSATGGGRKRPLLLSYIRTSPFNKIGDFGKVPRTLLLGTLVINLL